MKINCSARIMLVASFCASIFSASPASAAEETLEAVQARIAVLEQKKAELEAVIAKADAQIADAVSVSPQAVTLVSVATFTTRSPAEGWNAWKRQSREWKKSHPWEKVLAENCAREPKICRKTARAGTAFYLPAPEIRVIVPLGMTPPEAIALVPTQTFGVFALDPKALVATAAETKLNGQVADLKFDVVIFKSLAILFGIAAAVFFVFMILLYVLYEQACRKLDARNETITEASPPSDDTHKSESKTCGSGCCHTESSSSVSDPVKEAKGGCCHEETAQAETSEMPDGPPNRST